MRLVSRRLAHIIHATCKSLLRYWHEIHNLLKCVSISTRVGCDTDLSICGLLADRRGFRRKPSAWARTRREGTRNGNIVERQGKGLPWSGNVIIVMCNTGA